MKFFTLNGFKLFAYFRLKKLSPENLPRPYDVINNRKTLKRVSFSFALTFTALIQMAFAAPIKGRVTDETGSPLSGVSVTLKGSNVGASTTTDGKYTINVPELNGILVFTFVGYTAQEIPIDGRSADCKLDPKITGKTDFSDLANPRIYTVISGNRQVRKPYKVIVKYQ